jgi:Tfp pilus assembly protein PilE
MLVKRLKDQRGFTTVTIMGVLMVGGLLVAAAFTAVQPDISQSRSDQDSKQA